MMRRLGWACLLVCACECSKKKPPQAFAPVPAPPEVLATLALRSPEDAATRAGALWQKFGDLPAGFSGQSLREILASELSLGSPALDQVDLKKPVFGLFLDGKRIVQQNDSVFVLAVPIVDEAKFFEGLKQTRSEKVEADFRRFDPRAGGPSVCVATGQGYALMSEFPQALSVARPFVFGTLLPSGAQQDVEVRLLLDHWFDEPGEWEAKTAEWSQRLGSDGPLGRLFDALRDTQEIDLIGSVSSNGFQLSAGIFPKEAGRVRDLLARQKPGQAWGMERLAQGSWLVMSDHNDENALAEWAADTKWWLDLGNIPVANRADAAKHIEALAGSVEGSLAVGLRQQEGGFLASCVAKVADETKAKAAADGLGNLLAQSMGGRVGSLGSAVRGISFSDLTSQLAAPTPALNDLSLAWGVEDEVLGLAIGNGAMAEVAALLTDKRKPNITQDPTFSATAVERDRRVGFVYLSPVEAVKALASFAPGNPAELVDYVNNIKQQHGLLVEWGIAPNKAALTARFEIPIDTFMALKPLLGSLSLAIPSKPN